MIHRQFFSQWNRLASVMVATALLGSITGCATQQTRVTEVTPNFIRSYSQGSGDLMIQSGRTRFNSGMVGSSTHDAVTQEFFVRWNDKSVASVTFAYRQVNGQGETTELTTKVTDEFWHVFTIDKDAYKKNGMVSAWKVTLRDDAGSVLAEKQSVMW